ncbi:DUF6193 family natural product biosynthesis protein [Nocardia sp. NPDC059091]
MVGRLIGHRPGRPNALKCRLQSIAAANHCRGKRSGGWHNRCCERGHCRPTGDSHDDGGGPVEAKWDFYRTHAYYPYHDLIEAAYAEPQLRMLFPYSSTWILNLSRCIRYPFSMDVPCIRPVGTGKFEVRRTPNMPAGPSVITVADSAEDAVALVAANLPENCGPAIDGTIEDLRRLGS